MASSSCGGRGTPFGGISPARTLRRMMSHPSRRAVSEAGWVKGAISTPPDARFSLWQGVHVRLRTGATVFSKVGRSAADNVPHAHAMRAYLKISLAIAPMPPLQILHAIWRKRLPLLFFLR